MVNLNTLNNLVTKKIRGLGENSILKNTISREGKKVILSLGGEIFLKIMPRSGKMKIQT